jgi:hypothetical protein
MLPKRFPAGARDQPLSAGAIVAARRCSGTESRTNFTSPDANTIARRQVSRAETRHFAVNGKPAPLGMITFKRLQQPGERR